MATLSAAKLKPGTTPLLTVIVDNEDIHEATVYVTVDMKDRQLVKSTRTGNGDIIVEPIYLDADTVSTQVTVRYSQADTLFFRPGYASLEVGSDLGTRWVECRANMRAVVYDK